MDEAHQHPPGDELRLTRDHAIEQRTIGLPLPAGVRPPYVRKMAGDGMVGQRPQRLDVAARGEELEGADADVARRHARQHRARQRRLAHHRLTGRHGRQRSRGRNAERRHRLADDVFAQHGTQGRPPVAAARERCRPRAFELNVATDAVPAHDLAQQDGAAIAQLRHEVAELVAGIGQRNRLGTRRYAVARQDRHTLRRRQRLGIEAELGGESRVELDQARRRDRCGRKPHVEALRQAGVAVVERQ